VADPEPTAAVLVIGDEVLSGRVTDLNTLYLCRRLTELGVAVKRVVMLPDDVPAIAAEVAACAPHYTHVVTSGGVGPTHDDVTMGAVAEGLGRPLIRHPEALAVIRGFYGEGMRDAALRMADLPEGADLITRPGLRFPVIRVQNVWVFPGSPHLLKSKFEAVRDHFASTPFVTGTLHLDAGEPEVAPFLEEVQARFPDVAIGSYPQEPGVAVRLVLTARSKDPERVEAALQAMERGLPVKAARGPVPES